MNTAINALGEARRYLALTGVFALGLIGGIWAVLAPFAAGWPLRGDGSWTHAIWASVLTGAVLTGASGAAIVVTAGLAARAAAHTRALAAEELA